MGLTATFSVNAGGTSLHYQWKKDGAAITGATSATYTTPATQFSDSGSTYTVTVSNSSGSVTSNNAKLTITARAPQPGDLRFQQVDAASTVNGYNNGPVGQFTSLGVRMSTYFTSSIGTPLWLTPGETGAWPLAQFFLPSNLANLGLSVGYGVDFYSGFLSDLTSTTWVPAGSPVESPNSVVTSLGFEPQYNLFAISWIQSSQSTGFHMYMGTASPSNFPSVAANQGAYSHVITALSFNASGQIEYLAYGWDKDPSTIYQAKVVTADSVATIVQAATQLAAQGYIITATGSSNLNDSFVLVGTRVKGDTMPRPFIALKATTGTQVQNEVMNPGYALVGVVEDAKGNDTYLGER